jgi:hypothetical protein
VPVANVAGKRGPIANLTELASFDEQKIIAERVGLYQYWHSCPFRNPQAAARGPLAASCWTLAARCPAEAASTIE